MYVVDGKSNDKFERIDFLGGRSPQLGKEANDYEVRYQRGYPFQYLVTRHSHVLV